MVSSYAKNEQLLTGEYSKHAGLIKAQSKFLSKTASQSTLGSQYTQSSIDVPRPRPKETLRIGKSNRNSGYIHRLKDEVMLLNMQNFFTQPNSSVVSIQDSGINISERVFPAAETPPVNFQHESTAMRQLKTLIKNQNLIQVQSQQKSSSVQGSQDFSSTPKVQDHLLQSHRVTSKKSVKKKPTIVINSLEPLHMEAQLVNFHSTEPRLNENNHKQQDQVTVIENSKGAKTRNSSGRISLINSCKTVEENDKPQGSKLLLHANLV